MNNKQFHTDLDKILSDNKISYKSTNFTKKEVESIENVFKIIDDYDTIKNIQNERINSLNIINDIHNINLLLDSIDIYNDDIKYYHDKMNNAIKLYFK